MKHWVNTISKEHVDRGVEGEFTQADHGKATRLRRLERGDLVVFYSPRTAMRSGAPLQLFTAIGRVDDDEPYRVEMTPDFHPWRRRVSFFAAQEAAIKPLIDSLDFITSKKNWGFPFRRGLFEVSESDFLRIAKAMEAHVD